MPPRSEKMKRRIFGFQRLVWWPKWTPASSNSRMETAPALVETAIEAPSDSFVSCAGGSRGAPPARRGTRATAGPPGSGNRDAGRLAGPRSFQCAGQVGRQRRRDVDGGAGDGMGERE